MFRMILGAATPRLSPVESRWMFRGTALAIGVMLVAACTTGSPGPGTTARPPATGTSSAMTSPTTTAASPTTFPLAVVTGITNLKATTTVKELGALASRGELVIPCGVDVTQPALTSDASCVKAEEIPATLTKGQKRIALLPPGLVEPATKVLSIAGKGPFGMFGADLFGDAKARAMDYPVLATAEPGAGLEPSWTAYDKSEIWTMTNLGSLCANRGGATQAVARVS